MEWFRVVLQQYDCNFKAIRIYESKAFCCHQFLTPCLYSVTVRELASFHILMHQKNVVKTNFLGGLFILNIVVNDDISKLFGVSERYGSERQNPFEGGWSVVEDLEHDESLS
ncbi:hypothetical protein Plhal703r1_c11g0059321 [Plasmopara halstedii]